MYPFPASVATPPVAVAVFDLDGTITRRDTFLAFVLHVLRRRPTRVPRAAVLLPAALRYAVDRDRGALKQAVIRTVLAGLPRAELEAHVALFLDCLWRGQLRPGALAAIARHRAAGQRLVLLSASPDLYVPAIGARLGFDEVICTGVAWRGEFLDGRLTTPNRRGDEKRCCVSALRERHGGAGLAAYGNAASDLDHLAVVEAPCLVNADARTRRLAAARGIPCDDWP